MAKSIAQQVVDFLKKHPTATNTDLYKTFPKVRENTLRNYKYKFKNSIDQFKSNRKKNKQAAASPAKDTQASLRSKVFEFFKENPKATNQSLYKEFSEYSKNKLRHYKASFFKTDGSSVVKKPSPLTQAAKKLTTKPGKRTAASSDLEKRLSNLEKQVEQLTEIVLKQSEHNPIKSGIASASGNIEKKVKELEDTISSFIGEKRKKIKGEMANLEEMQQVVSEKIASFIKGFK